MPSVRSILESKGGDVATITGDATVFEAAKKMNERKIGALVVTDGDRAVGIFTERDILNRIVAAGFDPKKTKVQTVMTSPMACGRRDSKLAECRSVMASKKIRHLPIVEEGNLYGMISAGDILASESAEQQATIEYLHEYLHAHR